jgi:hypothetical protein
LTRISTNPEKPRGRWTAPLAEIGGKRPTWSDIAWLGAFVVVGVGLAILALAYA